jgi:hypothetical protein
LLLCLLYIEMARIDFMPNWKKEEDCFKNALRRVRDANGKFKNVSWQRPKPPIQWVYEQWQNDVYDEENEEYYPERDQRGNPIKGTGAKYLINNIFRVRTNKNGKEYLISMGRLEAFDSFGNKKIRAINSPEKWDKTLFGQEQTYCTVTNKMITQVTGMVGQETVYELPFNEKNLNKLLDQRESDNVNLCLRVDGAAESRGISNAGDYATQVKLFKTKDFDYLCNEDYLTPQQKEEMRKEAEARGLVPPRLYTQSDIEAGQVYRNPTKAPEKAYQ